MLVMKDISLNISSKQGVFNNTLEGQVLLPIDVLQNNRFNILSHRIDKALLVFIEIIYYSLISPPKIKGLTSLASPLTQIDTIYYRRKIIN